MTPTVTAVIPTYRRAEDVARAVSSALKQTIAPLEVIVVDDEPSDATNLAVASVADERVRYIAHERNRGLSAARNTAIMAAQGEWIAFLDDDDEWMPEKLERQLEVIARMPDPVVVTSYERWLRQDDTSHIRDVSLNGEVLQTLLTTDAVHMQTLLVPRSVFADVGVFDESIFHHEDMDMAIRLARRYRFATVPEPLTVIHVTPNSLSSNLGNRIAALEHLIDKHVEYRCDRRLRSRLLCRLARLHAANHNVSAWKQCLRDALELWPINSRAAAMLASGTVLGPGVNVKAAQIRNRLAARDADGPRGDRDQCRDSLAQRRGDAGCTVGVSGHSGS